MAIAQSTNTGISASLAALDMAMNSAAAPSVAPVAPVAQAPVAAPAPQIATPQQIPVPIAAPEPQAAPLAQPMAPVPGQAVQVGAQPIPAQAQQPDPAQAQEPPTVPSFRLREETSKRQQAETDLTNMRSQMARMEADNVQLLGTLQALLGPQPPAQQAQAAPPQPPAPKPDLYTDPEGYAAAVREEALAEAQRIVSENNAALQRELYAQKANTSFIEASRVYGRDVAASATQAAKAAGLQDQFMATADPVGNAVKWHQEEQAREIYGTDPKTIQSRAEQQILADPAAVARIFQAYGFQAPTQLAPATPQPTMQPMQPAPVAQPIQVAPQPQVQPVPSFAAAPRAAVQPAPVVVTSRDAVNSFLAGRRAQLSGAPPPARV